MQYILLILFYIIGLPYKMEHPIPIKQQCLEDNKIWENSVYKEGINTVLIFKTGQELSMPLIQLNSDEQVSLFFDEMGTKKRSYSYSIVHCNHDWQQSDIEPIDYIGGLNDGTIDEVKLSQNTMINYVNYRLDIPNDDCKLLVSGNYIVKVYENNDPEKLVLTRRFYVYENLTTIKGNIENITTYAPDGLNQRVNFSVKYNTDEIEYPYETLSYKIIKNNETEKSFKNLKPSAINNNLIRFENMDMLSFAGGNEYRHFDTKSLKFLSDRLQKIEKKQDTTIVSLLPDIDRLNEKYRFEHDLDGRKLIKLENNEISNIMADYCLVTFELDAVLPLENGGYYLQGSISDWSAAEKYRMNYSHASQKFEKTLLLKQGYYNYLYIFKPDDKRFNNESDQFRIEGNHFMTENDYHIFVYYRSYGKNFDQLIGYHYLNSQIQNMD